MSLIVCLCVCLFVHKHISGTTRSIFNNFCACYLWLCSVILWQCCNIFGFMDDTIFAYNRLTTLQWVTSLHCCTQDISPVSIGCIVLDNGRLDESIMWSLQCSVSRLSYAIYSKIESLEVTGAGFHRLDAPPVTQQNWHQSGKCGPQSSHIFWWMGVNKQQPDQSTTATNNEILRSNVTAKLI